MSHGGGGDGAIAEPNLTPLLDVVMQLLMFFMMCVNFVSEQVNEDVKLPASQAVKPMDKSDPDVLFVNFRPFAVKDFQDHLPADALERAQRNFREGDPCVLVTGKEPMKIVQLESWLTEQYSDAKKEKGDNVNTAIIIRADKDAEYSRVYQILQMCKVVGYKRLGLRAMTRNSGG